MADFVGMPLDDDDDDTRTVVKLLESTVDSAPRRRQWELASIELTEEKAAALLEKILKGGDDQNG